MMTTQKPLFRSRKKVSYIFFLGLLLIVVYSLFGGLYQVQSTVDSNQLPPVQVIVCLGGGRGRIHATGALWYQYWQNSKGSTPILYFAGMGSQAHWGLISKQIPKNISSLIPESEVLVEKISLNTVSNAQWLMHHARKKGWQHILLLTSNYHMKRAQWIFHQLFNRADFPVQFETWVLTQEPGVSNQWYKSVLGMRLTATEYLKWVYYRYFWKPQIEDV